MTSPFRLRFNTRVERHGDRVGRTTNSLNYVAARLRKKWNCPITSLETPAGMGASPNLEVAELSDGQGRALSTHKTQQSYEGCAKRTAKRMFSAARRRYAHRLTNETATPVQNEQGTVVQNEMAGKKHLSISETNGALGEIRTPDPRNRNPMLYPAELRVLESRRND